MINFDKNKISHRIYAVISVYIALGLADIFLLRLYECPIRNFIGMDCPTCGVTRAGSAILQLDFVSAWHLNPLIYILILYIVVITVQYIADKLKNSHLIFYAVSFMGIAIIRWIILILK